MMFESECTGGTHGQNQWHLARDSTSDISESGPIRSGGANFGQGEVSSAATRRTSSRTRELPFPEQEGGAPAKPMSKDEQQAEMVRKMNERFFNTRPEASTPGGSTPGAQQPSMGGSVQAGAGAQSAPVQEQVKVEMIPDKPEEELESGPTGFFKDAPRVDELYPKGSFLNTVA